MTAQERRFPNIILQSGSRRRRIIEGSGTQAQDLQRLLKEYEQMQKVMKKLTNKQGLAKMMQGLSSRFPSTDLPK